MTAAPRRVAVTPASSSPLALLLSLGVKTLAGPVRDDNSRLHDITGLIGTTVSGTFLCLIAAINLVVLAGIWKVFRRMRSGRYDEAALEEQLNNRGFMNRLLGRGTRSITKPWPMYPLGLLFGLDLNTAGFAVAGLFAVTWIVALVNNPTGWPC